MPDWNQESIPEDDNTPRFVHIDLPLSRDSCGIAVIKFWDPAHALNPETGITEIKPGFMVEAEISIKPSSQTELDFAELRRWLMVLVDQFGIDIHRVSFDSYQSVEFGQVLRSRGIRTKEISVDRSPGHYETLRDIVYGERIVMVESVTLHRELVELEFNAIEQCIDHPPRGSKDVVDAVCGAIANTMSTRYARNDYGYFDRDGDRITPDRESHWAQRRSRLRRRNRS